MNGYENGRQHPAEWAIKLRVSEGVVFIQRSMRGLAQVKKDGDIDYFGSRIQG